jgi:glycosidase
MNRFLWVVQGDVRRLKTAALCQFTLPHPPVIYYGTEVGRSQVRDVRSPDGSGPPEESRLPMLWGDAQDAELLGFYRRLIALRRRTPWLWRGMRETLLTDDDAGLYAYRCAEGSDQAIVVLNTSADPRTYRSEGAGPALAFATDDGVAFDGERLSLPAYAGAVLAHFSSGSVAPSGADRVG